MRRCKAVTSRACDSIECVLMPDHEGAHEGQRDKETRAVWTNPEAPTYLPIEGAPLEGSAQAFEQARAARLATLPTVAEEPSPKTPQTHCHCGSEHEPKHDPTLRNLAALPLVAWDDQQDVQDQRFAWAKVCRNCGAVYCSIWKTL